MSVQFSTCSILHPPSSSVNNVNVCPSFTSNWRKMNFSKSVTTPNKILLAHGIALRWINCWMHWTTESSFNSPAEKKIVFFIQHFGKFNATEDLQRWWTSLKSDSNAHWDCSIPSGIRQFHDMIKLIKPTIFCIGRKNIKVRKGFQFQMKGPKPKLFLFLQCCQSTAACIQKSGKISVEKRSKITSLSVFPLYQRIPNEQITSLKT